MVSDFTGGPVQLYLTVASNGVLAVKMGAHDFHVMMIRRKIRKRVLSEYPEFRLNLDGRTYH